MVMFQTSGLWSLGFRAYCTCKTPSTRIKDSTLLLARKCMDFRGTHQKFRILGDTGLPKKDYGLARLE